MSDFNITLFEACELLNKSKKSISRYIKQGLLHPERVKSQQGTLEYRFNKADIETLKAQELNAKETGQDRTQETRRDRPDKTRETGQGDDIIMLLKETTGLLKEQLTKKDDQINALGGTINQLIERDRETNILLGQLQSKVLMLELKEPINDDAEETRQDTEDQTGQREPKPAKMGLMKWLCQLLTQPKNRI